MPDISARAGPFMAAVILCLLTSRLLAGANQDLFGVPSDFLAGFILALGIVVFAARLALTMPSSRNASH